MTMETRPSTILVVDDHVPLAQAFARALTSVGYQALVAHSAEVALCEAHSHHPDAIILDFQMPFVNGVGLLYRLRAEETFRGTPVLVITGQTLNDEVRAELRALNADLLMKPIGIAGLVTATRMLLEKRDAGGAGSPDADRVSGSPRTC